MSHDHGNRVSTDKQRGRQQVVESESPPPIPKRSRTKVQASKDSTNGVLSKKAKRSSDASPSSLAKLCGKDVNLLPEDSLQK